MKTQIKILGTGCPKCKSMETVVQKVVTENNLNATVDKVEDIMKIMEYDVIITPAMVVNNNIVIKGRVPSKKEVLDNLNGVSNNSGKDNNSCCSTDTCC